MINLSRQREIVQGTADVLIIGSGSLGSNAANVLASIGCKVTLFDGDVWSEPNIAPSFTMKELLGEKKATSTAELINERLGADNVVGVDSYYEDQNLKCDVLVLAVDSLRVRRQIYRKGLIEYELLIDARMGFDQGGVYNHVPGQNDDWYEKWLNVEPAPLPCGQKATAFVSAGLVPGAVGMVVARYINNIPIPKRVFFQTLTDVPNMFVSTETIR